MKKLIFLSFLITCFVYTSQSQVTATPPDPIILCDVNNPGDETETFDMTIREAQIINGQTNVVVTYHPTSGDALSGINAIPNPESYNNQVNPQIIFIRLQSTNGNGSDVVILELIVPLIPQVVEQPDDITVNDGDGDGMAEFDLTVNQPQALGTQDPFVFNFSYYLSEENASNVLNPITNPESFINSINPQIIYVRMAPLQDQCDFKVYNFKIEADGALGTVEIENDTFSIYPNPAQNLISIDFKDLNRPDTIVIYDNKGVVLKKIITVTSAIDISSFAAGIYFVEATYASNKIIKKLIKK